MTDEPAQDTPLAIAAVTMHEVFVMLFEAGFTEDQALRLVVLMAVERERGDSGR